MSYVGRILWVHAVQEQSRPYLCVFETEDLYQTWGVVDNIKSGVVCLDIIDLESADKLTILLRDIDDLIKRGQVHWDDQ